jgi:16S rRNA (cytosine1402-N4)-methyltransferase
MDTKKSEIIHQSVLLNETMDGLDPKPGEIFLDGTLGGGGHSEAACQRVAGRLTIIGLDMDGGAIPKAEERIKNCGCKIFPKRENFRNLDKAIAELGIKSVNKILLDLGLSSDELEASGRGFSFQKSEPLIMTFKDKEGEADLTAEDVVNSWSQESLEQIIFGFGEERRARKIAAAIVGRRQKKEIKTSLELAEIIQTAVGRTGRTHPATKTFQAIRIAVNDELEALKDALEKGLTALTSGGRMAVISFHSLEDRIVKNFIRGKAKTGLLKVLTKKPIIPSDGELTKNRRARSAKLRIFEKI